MTDLSPDFAGPVRLFPLPNVVLFPQVIQPLHIFEPRYCNLLEDALATDHLITLALLQTGWETDYEGRPPVHSIVCVGEIISHARLPENRHNVLLRGVHRARILREIPAAEFGKYRQAMVKLLPNQHDPHSAGERGDRQAKLIELFRRFLPQSAQWEQQLDQLLSRPLDLGVLTDIVAFTAGFMVERKQQLLAETNVDRRAQALLQMLEQALKHPESLLPPSRHEFPPPFSAN